MLHRSKANIKKSLSPRPRRDQAEKHPDLSKSDKRVTFALLVKL
jgi:hypothetical protein